MAIEIGSRKTAAVINVTPLIDVLLVLLITFMLLPNRSKGLPAEAPDPAPDAPSAPGNPLDVVVRIANLSLSLVGFGIFTLKSMSLSRYLAREPKVDSSRQAVESTPDMTPLVKV